MAVMPSEWERFLDQVESKLGILLEGCAAREEDWAAAEPAAPALPIAERLQASRSGLDDRLAKLEARLRGLDDAMASAEAEAQRLQQAAHQVRLEQIPAPGGAIG